MICKQCGNEIPDDSIFCPECGMKIEILNTEPESEPVTELVTEQESEPVPEAEAETVIENVAEPVIETVIEPETVQVTKPEPVVEDVANKCTNCGTVIPDDSIFCPKCGTKQEKTPVNNDVTIEKTPNQNEDIEPTVFVKEPQVMPEQDNTTVLLNGGIQNVPSNGNNMFKPVNENNSQSAFVNQRSVSNQSVPVNQNSSIGNVSGNKNNVMTAIIAAAAVVACCVAAYFYYFAKPVIDLNKYVTISTEGYDKVGKANVEIDMDELEADCEKKMKKNKSIYVEDYVSGKIDKKIGLSNGDTITFEWECDDEEVLEKYGIKFKYKNIEYKVSGLKDVETFDPFDGIEVEFSGIEPQGYANITGTPNDSAAKDFIYQLDKDYFLEEGDVVTVTAGLQYCSDVEEYCAEQYGKVPLTLEKEYTVEGLPKYVKNVSEINEKGLSAMQSQAKDVYYAKVVAEYDEGEVLKGFDYIGNYFLTTKDPKKYVNMNAIVLVYKVTVNNAYSNGSSGYNRNNSYYWYVRFEDLLIKDKEGLYVDLSRYTTPDKRFTIDSGVSKGWWSTKEWDYYGYQNINELYKDTVISNMDLYNHEDNVDDNTASISEVAETANVPDNTSGGLKKIDIASISASSTLNVASKDNSTYYASNLIDNNLSTAWVEGVQGLGIGESVTIQFSEKKMVSELHIYPGYQKTKYRYAINGQPTKVLLEWEDGNSIELDLTRVNTGLDDVPFSADEAIVDIVDMGTTMETSYIKMTILDAVGGTKYDDVAISEIGVYTR